jgi:hypothetical protein
MLGKMTDGLLENLSILKIISSMKNEITVVFFGFQVRFGKT